MECWPRWVITYIHMNVLDWLDDVLHLLETIAWPLCVVGLLHIAKVDQNKFKEK